MAIFRHGKRTGEMLYKLKSAAMHGFASGYNGAEK